MLTLKQFVEQARRAYVLEYPELTLAYMRREQPDSWYYQEYGRYVTALAGTGIQLTARNLDHIWFVFGGHYLSMILRHNEHVAPKYYVHPDCRNIS